MKLSYRLEDFNEKEIVSKFNMQEGGKAELFLADNCFRRMEKYTPWKTGALATTATITPGKISYDTPYAAKQYYTNKGNGLRGKAWDKKMVANEGDIILRELASYIEYTKGKL